MSKQITYESNHISLLLDLTIPCALNFSYFHMFYCNLKEKDPIRRKKNITKMFICEISIIIILICKKLGSIGSGGRGLKKNKLTNNFSNSAELTVTLDSVSLKFSLCIYDI